MRTVKLLPLLLALLIFGFKAKAQDIPQLSPEAFVSVFTCDAGDDLYKKFGHTALRVADPAMGIDITYNYGTFDFRTPNFYMKFLQGKLMYLLTTISYRNFLPEYIINEQDVYEQILELDTNQVQRVFAFVQTNRLPENREYKYDFLYDNCATRVRDVLSKSLGDELIYNDSIAGDSESMRELLAHYIGGLPWLKLGIDLLIGVPGDHVATAQERMFLPDFMRDELELAKVMSGGKWRPLVAKGGYTNKAPEREPQFVVFGPVILFCLLFLFVVWMSIGLKRNPLALRLFDGTWFIIIGLVGLLATLMWFATEHDATQTNLNVLWAFPITLIAAPWLYKRKRPLWLRLYFMLFIVLSIGAVLVGALGVQGFGYAVYPIIGISVTRALAIIRHHGVY